MKRMAGSQWATLISEVWSLYRQGHYDRAVVVAKKAVKIAEKAVGPDHPDVATSLNSLAVMYARVLAGRAAREALRWRFGRKSWVRIILMWLTA